MRRVAKFYCTIAFCLIGLTCRAAAEDLWNAGLFFQNISRGELDEYKDYIEKRIAKDTVLASERGVRRCESVMLNVPIAAWWSDVLPEIEREFLANPENVEVKKRLARVYANVDLKERATGLLEEILVQNADDTESQLLLWALAIEDNDQYAATVEKMEKLAQVEPYAWILLVKSACRAEKYDDVVRFSDAYFQMMADGPALEYGSLRLQRAIALFNLDQRLEDAQADFLCGIELTSSSSTNRENARKALIFVHAGLGQVSEAIEDAKREANPVETLLNIGCYLAKRDKLAHAVEVLSEAIELDPANQEIGTPLMYVLAKLKRMDEARRVYAQLGADMAYAQFVADHGAFDKAFFLARWVAAADEDEENHKKDDRDEVDLYEMAAVAAQKILREQPNLNFPKRAACVFCILRNAYPDGETDGLIELVLELKLFAKTDTEIQWVDELESGIREFLTYKARQRESKKSSVFRGDRFSQPVLPNLLR